MLCKLRSLRMRYAGRMRSLLARRSLLQLSQTRLPAARLLCTNRPGSGPSDPDFAEEEMSFLHRSMYPKRDRILYSLANALHEHARQNSGGVSRNCRCKKLEFEWEHRS